MSTTSPPTATLISRSTTLVFIDASIDDYQHLVSGVIPTANVFVIEPTQDGVEQISQVLRQYPTVDAVHIVSHGAPGCLYLGNTQLSLDTLDHYAHNLRQWSVTNLLLYGCRVAAGDAGSEFVEKLHTLTGASIASSAVLVGSTTQCRNWNLEVAIGQTIHTVAFQPETLNLYAGSLGVLGPSEDSFRIGHTVDNSSSDSDPNIVIRTYSSTYKRVEGGYSVTALNDGGFVTTWMSETEIPGSGSSSSLNGQRYNADGHLVGNEFQIWTMGAGTQDYRKVLNLRDGGFVVIWSEHVNWSERDVWGQRYDANSNPVGTEFQINPTIREGGDAVLAAELDRGGFVVVWEDKNEGLYGQRYDANCNSVGSEFQINSSIVSSSAYRNDATLVALDGGGFVVTWYQSDKVSPTEYQRNLYGRLYDSFGKAVGSDFQINTEDGNYKHGFLGQNPVAALDGGGFVITWLSPDQSILGQRYDANGVRLGGNFQANTYDSGQQMTPTVAALNGGGFVMVWRSSDTLPPIMGQLYDASGDRVGGEFRVNDGPEEAATDRSFRVDVNALSDGGFAVTWASYDMYIQQYDASGNRVGDSPKIVSHPYSESRHKESFTMLSDGSAIVAWEHYPAAAENEAGIFGQMLRSVPLISFNIPSNPQESGQGEFELRLSEASPTDITVSYAVSGTAIAGEDYKELPGSIVIPAGITNIVVPIDLRDDSIDEETETITLHLQDGVGYALELAEDDRQATLEIIDNDTAGIIGTLTSGVTKEAGQTASFDFKLNSQPLHMVQMSFNNDSEEGTLSTSYLIFTPDDWNVYQTLTVTAVDDFDIDGSQTYTIETTVFSSDVKYNRIETPDLNITNLDNDVAGITIELIDAITTEAGETASFSVVLNAGPRETVILDINGMDAAEGSLSASSLSFDNSNWDTPKIVTITGIDDLIDDGDQTYTLTFDASDSSDADYAALTEANLMASGKTVEITNQDDDITDIVLSSSTGLTSEDGSQATFTVYLGSQPSSDVEIVLSSSNELEGAVAPANLIFTPTDFSTPQTITVTGLDDSTEDGAQDYTVTFTPRTSDPDYNALSPKAIALTNLDNETVPIASVRSTDATISENGELASFLISLSVPALPGKGTIHYAISGTATNGDDYGLITDTVEISAGETEAWVTLRPIDDRIGENSETVTLTILSVNGDSEYAPSGTLSTATVTITDDDAAPTVIMTPTSQTTHEAGGVAIIDVVLSSQPTADVTIDLVSSDTGEGNVSTSSLTFTPANWNTPQQVTVTGTDDADLDGEQSYTIQATATSSDAAYGGMAIAPLTLSNLDNDGVAILVTPSNGEVVVGEAGVTDTYQIALTQPPTGTVELVAHADPQTEISLDGTTFASSQTLTLNGTTYQQTVFVRATDDSTVEGNHSSTIIHRITSSTDANYPTDFVVPTVTVSIEDNDLPRVHILSTDPGSEESTIAGRFNLLLSEPAPAGGLTVSYQVETSSTAKSDNNPPFTVGEPDYFALPGEVFIPAGETGATINVVPTPNDAAVEPEEIVTITLLNGDGYTVEAGQETGNVSIFDDDIPGVRVTESGNKTWGLEGASDSYTISLTSQPRDPVTINFATDGAVAAIAPLTFTSDNWKVPQTVSVQFSDDNLSNGDRATTITHTVTSGDADYHAIAVQDVNASVLDDDVSGITLSATNAPLTEGETGVAAYTMVLNTQPSSDVTVSFVHNGSLEQVTPLTFTSGNWNVPQTVSITPVDNDRVSGVRTSTILHQVSSSDPGYDQLAIQNTTIKVLEDDHIGIKVTPSDGTNWIHEGNSTDSYQVVLESQPTSNVTVEFSASSNLAAISPLVFTPTNWNTPQSVTLQAPDNGIEQNLTRTDTIYATVRSSDAPYNGYPLTDISVSIGDPVGITVEKSLVQVGEDGRNDSYTIVLDSQPFADVTIEFSVDDTLLHPIAPITFTRDNWNVPQTLTIEAIADTVTTGSIIDTAITQTVISDDRDYDAVALADIKVDVLNDDTYRSWQELFDAIAAQGITLPETFKSDLSSRIDTLMLPVTLKSVSANELVIAYAREVDSSTLINQLPGVSDRPEASEFATFFPSVTNTNLTISQFTTPRFEMGVPNLTAEEIATFLGHLVGSSIPAIVTDALTSDSQLILTPETGFAAQNPGQAAIAVDLTPLLAGGSYSVINDSINDLTDLIFGNPIFELEDNFTLQPLYGSNELKVTGELSNGLTVDIFYKNDEIIRADFRAPLQPIDTSYLPGYSLFFDEIPLTAMDFILNRGSSQEKDRESDLSKTFDVGTGLNLISGLSFNDSDDLIFQLLTDLGLSDIAVQLLLDPGGQVSLTGFVPSGEELFSIGDFTLSYEETSLSMASVAPDFTPGLSVTGKFKLENYDPFQTNEPALYLSGELGITPGAPPSASAGLLLAPEDAWVNPFGMPDSEFRKLALQTDFTLNPSGVPPLTGLGFKGEFKFGNYNLDSAFFMDISDPAVTALLLTVLEPLTFLDLWLGPVNSFVLNQVSTEVEILADFMDLVDRLLDAEVSSFDTDNDGELDPMIQYVPFPVFVAGDQIPQGLGVALKASVYGVEATLMAEADPSLESFRGALSVDRIDFGGLGLVIIEGVNDSTLDLEINLDSQNQYIAGDGRIEVFGFELVSADFYVGLDGIDISGRIASPLGLSAELELRTDSVDGFNLEGSGSLAVFGYDVANADFRIGTDGIAVSGGIDLGIVDVNASVLINSGQFEIEGTGAIEILGHELASASIIGGTNTGNITVTGGLNLGLLNLDVRATASTNDFDVVANGSLELLGYTFASVSATANSNGLDINAFSRIGNPLASASLDLDLGIDSSGFDIRGDFDVSLASFEIDLGFWSGSFTAIEFGATPMLEVRNGVVIGGIEDIGFSVFGQGVSYDLVFNASDAIDSWDDILDEIYDSAVDEAWGLAKDIFGSVGDFVEDAVDAVGDFVEDTVDAVGDFFSWGYIDGATVWFDANNNGLLDGDEPNAITGGDGRFLLAIPDSLDRSTGVLRAQGGIDVATGTPVQGVLSAALGSAINPITALVQELVEQGLSDTDAQDRVRNAFGIAATIDLADFRYIDQTLDGNSDARPFLIAVNSVQGVMSGVHNLLAGALGSTVEALDAETNYILGDSSYSALASVMDGSPLDLTDASVIEAVIQQAIATATTIAQQRGISLNLDASAIGAIADEIAQVLAAGATKKHLLSTESADGLELLTRITQAKQTSHGEEAEAINKFAQGLISESTLLTLADTSETALQAIRDIKLAPQLAGILDLNLKEGQPLVGLPVTLYDFETSRDQLKVQITSDNPDLLPDKNVTIDPGAQLHEGLLNIAPIDGKTGIANLSITVEDSDGNTLTEDFSVKVTAQEPAILLSKDTISVSETGTTDSFTVALNAQPTSNVVVQLASSDTGEATVSSNILNFTPDNWHIAQTVTVTGVDDVNVDGNQNSLITMSVDTANSDDSFDGLTPESIHVMTLDNDVHSGPNNDALDVPDVRDTLDAEIMGTAMPKIKFKTGKKGDRLAGTKDKDKLKGTRNNDVLLGKKGNDRLVGRNGDDRLKGAAGNDKLIGGIGDDLLLGGDDNDRIWGQKGNDLIVGGAGNDKLIGGQGTDTFVYESLKDGTDKIKKFDTSRDLFDLSGLFKDAAFAGDSNFQQFNQFVKLVEVGGSTKIQVDQDGNAIGTEMVTLARVQSVVGLTSQNFVI